MVIIVFVWFSKDSLVEIPTTDWQISEALIYLATWNANVAEWEKNDNHSTCIVYY